MYKPFALILENNSDNAALFCHVLDLAGFLTEIVSDSQAIVERLSNSQPNIVILNLDLTDIDSKRRALTEYKSDRGHFSANIIQ